MSHQQPQPNQTLLSPRPGGSWVAFGVLTPARRPNCFGVGRGTGPRHLMLAPQHRAGLGAAAWARRQRSVLGSWVGVRAFSTFLNSNRVPHGFTQDPSTDRVAHGMQSFVRPHGEVCGSDFDGPWALSFSPAAGPTNKAIQSERTWRYPSTVCRPPLARAAVAVERLWTRSLPPPHTTQPAHAPSKLTSTTASHSRRKKKDRLQFACSIEGSRRTLSSSQ